MGHQSCGSFRQGDPKPADTTDQAIESAVALIPHARSGSYVNQRDKLAANYNPEKSGNGTRVEWQIVAPVASFSLTSVFSQPKDALALACFGFGTLEELGICW